MFGSYIGQGEYCAFIWVTIEVFIILFSTTVLETNTIRWYLASRLKNSWEEESARRNSEYGYARGVYLDSSILFSDSTLLCLANKRLVDHTTSLIWKVIGPPKFVWYDIEWLDPERSKDPIYSLLPGVYGSILPLGTVFPRTLLRANIRNTPSRGKHLQCSSNDANGLNVDICRQATWHHIGCTIWTKLKQ